MSTGATVPDRLSRITMEDMTNIALGGAFLGTGGGGDPRCANMGLSMCYR